MFTVIGRFLECPLTVLKNTEAILKNTPKQSYTIRISWEWNFKSKCQIRLTVYADNPCFLHFHIFRRTCCFRRPGTLSIGGWTGAHIHFNLFHYWNTMRVGVLSTKIENYSQRSLVAYRKFTLLKISFHNKYTLYPDENPSWLTTRARAFTYFRHSLRNDPYSRTGCLVPHPSLNKFTFFSEECSFLE